MENNSAETRPFPLCELLVKVNKINCTPLILTKAMSFTQQRSDFLMDTAFCRLEFTGKNDTFHTEFSKHHAGNQ